MLPCSPLMISQSGPNRPSRGPTIVASLRRAPEWMRCDRVDSCPAGRCPKGATVPKLALRLRALIGEQDSPVDGDRGRQGSMMEGRGCRGCQEICRKGPSVEGRCAHCSCWALVAWMARPTRFFSPGVCWVVFDRLAGHGRGVRLERNRESSGVTLSHCSISSPKPSSRGPPATTTTGVPSTQYDRAGESEGLAVFARPQINTRHIQLHS
jgi:hypothetical protein